jgi:hypothetical protein
MLGPALRHDSSEQRSNDPTAQPPMFSADASSMRLTVCVIAFFDALKS